MIFDEAEPLLPPFFFWLDDGSAAGTFRRHLDGALLSQISALEGKGLLLGDCSIAAVVGDNDLPVGADGWALFSLVSSLPLPSLPEAAGLEANAAANSAAITNFTLSSRRSGGIGNQQADHGARIKDAFFSWARTGSTHKQVRLG